MENSKLEKQLNKTWKKLLKASLSHNDSQMCSLQKELILLEIEKKKRRQ